MKSILLSGATAEDLQIEVERVLAQTELTTDLEHSTMGHTYEYRAPLIKEIVSVQQYNKQLVTPNHLQPNNPKVEFVFQLLIIYK